MQNETKKDRHPVWRDGWEMSESSLTARIRARRQEEETKKGERALIEDLENDLEEQDREDYNRRCNPIFQRSPQGQLQDEYEGYEYESEVFPNLKMVSPQYALLMSFLIPVIVMVLIFIQRGIFPFGEESFLRTDMYHQYAPFFSEFRYKLTHGGSLLYSWDVGMGVNFAALFAYYLASPLNWLILLCPAKYVIEFMTISIVVKIGLCGWSMAYYLRHHCKTQDFGIVFFGIFYALSGYMAAYSWNIMWLDCIVIFPLIMLALEHLVKEGKGMAYCLLLGFSILSNYYISIMTCMFLVFYMIALLILEQEMTLEKFVGRLFQFAGYSLLAGGLSAVVLLPEIFALQSTASGSSTFPQTFTQYFSIFDMLARHIGNVETEIGLDHWPNIYCGVAVIMLFFLYLGCRQIRPKEKVVSCVLLLFFLASFSINVLNYIWHGFHYPNSLPCRQSYIYIWLVLLICYEAYIHLAQTPWKQVVRAFGYAVAFVLMAQKLLENNEQFHFVVFYVAILFLALYLAGIAWYKKKPRWRCIILFYTLAVVTIEASVNTAVTSVTTTSRTEYTRDNSAVENLVSTVQPNETFFRIKKDKGKTKNDGAWMHFPSVSLFSSTASADLSKLFKKLGCESSTNAYSITGSTPLIDSLFSVKYGLYPQEQPDSGLQTFLAQENETWLYENKYTLPLGFLVDRDFFLRWELDNSKPADVQNSLADAIGADQVLEMMMDVADDGASMSFTPEQSGLYYAYVRNKKVEKVSADTWNGSRTFTNTDRGYLLELGWCVSGEEVVLTAEETSEPLDASVYRFSEPGLRSVYDRLSEQPWTLTSWTDSTLEGTITCKASGVMMTTIPYDKGWKIFVDGEERTAEKVLDAFIGVDLTPGEHTISMKYFPEGLMPGTWITVGSIVILLMIFGTVRLFRNARLYEQKHGQNQQNQSDGEEDHENDIK